jgi:dolichol kinase
MLGVSLSTFLPDNWIIEPPLKLSNARSPEDALRVLILSRMNLVNVSTLCSTMLLLHVCASWFYEARCRKTRPGVPEGERASVPRSEVRRFWLFVFFGLSVTIGSLCLRLLSDALGVGIWQRKQFILTLCIEFASGPTSSLY